MCGRPETRLRWRLVGAILGLAGGAAAAEPPRLMGIVINGQDRSALFATAPTQWAREGDLVGDERVTAIEASAVHLDGPTGPRLVEPGEDRSSLRKTTPPSPLIDPYRRERETENDQ